MIEFLTGLGFDLSTDLGIYWVICFYMFTVVTILWVVGLLQGNHSVMDGFYGFCYASAAWLAFWLTEANSLYSGILFLMVSMHGCRLGYYLLKRWFGYRNVNGGDARYLKFVEQLAPAYWLKSFFLVMHPQTLVIMIIGLPAYFGIMATADSSAGLNIFALAGILLFGIGTYYEWLADGQLQAFKQDPANKGRYTEFGVWRLTRHPNYFGNTCVWWGIYITAVAGNPDIWWTIAGPLMNTLMLTKILGTSFQDKHMGARPEYAALIKRTSGFLPRPPKK